MAGALKKKISLRGWMRLARWTLFGTLGCLVVSLAFNYVAFLGHSPESVRQAMISAAVIPVILAGPLFFYLTLKLRELAIANHRLGVMASTDSLTSCLNRGAFSATVDESLKTGTAPRAIGQGALLVMDADFFKKINDQFGHEKGDEALRIIANTIRASVRKRDVVGRLGGEEFGVFLPGATQENASDVAERIRSAIAGAAFAPAGVPYPLSITIGGAIYKGTTSFRDLFRAADHRLYAAKSSGRNRVDLASFSLSRVAPRAIAAVH